MVCSVRGKETASKEVIAQDELQDVMDGQGDEKKPSHRGLLFVWFHTQHLFLPLPRRFTPMRISTCSKAQLFASSLRLK